MCQLTTVLVTFLLHTIIFASSQQPRFRIVHLDINLSPVTHFRIFGRYVRTHLGPYHSHDMYIF